MRQEKFGLYTAVGGKLSVGDSRAAYVTGPCHDGSTRPLASFWSYEEAVRFASERKDVTQEQVTAAYEAELRDTPLGRMTPNEYLKITGRVLVYVDEKE